MSAVACMLLFIGGCSKNDAINQAEKQDAVNGVPVPSIAETTAIAEEGFIYGLPIVMNYAVMYQFNVDKTSPQYKAPFDTIFNEARVFTYKDTAVITPNSDTPYSLLMMDLRTEPMVLSVPAVPKGRYYAVQLTDGNTFNFGTSEAVPPGRNRATTWSSDPTGRAKHLPRSKRCFIRPPSFQWRSSALNS